MASAIALRNDTEELGLWLAREQSRRMRGTTYGCFVNLAYVVADDKQPRNRAASVNGSNGDVRFAVAALVFEHDAVVTSSSHKDVQGDACHLTG